MSPSLSHTPPRDCVLHAGVRIDRGRSLLDSQIAIGHPPKHNMKRTERPRDITGMLEPCTLSSSQPRRATHVFFGVNGWKFAHHDKNGHNPD